MLKLIRDFIASEYVAHVAVNEAKSPYIFSCFYAFDDEGYALVFKTSPDANHTKKTALIKGIQARGILQEPALRQIELYYQVYPFAHLAEGRICALELEWCKYTDNSLMLSRKLEYYRESKNSKD